MGEGVEGGPARIVKKYKLHVVKIPAKVGILVVERPCPLEP
jgi:hypothetical protein